jgi:hypothetical protein
VLQITGNKEKTDIPESNMPSIWILPNSTRAFIGIGTQSDPGWGITTRSLPTNTYSNVTLVTAGKLIMVYINSILNSCNGAPSERPAGKAQLSFGNPIYERANARVKLFKLQEIASNTTELNDLQGFRKKFTRFRWL